MATSSPQSHSVLDTRTHTLPSVLAAMEAACHLLMLARRRPLHTRPLISRLLHTRPVPPVMVDALLLF